MTIKNRFDLQQEVYLITDPEQCKGFVVGIFVTPGAITYTIASNGIEYECYDFELSPNKQLQL